MRALDATDEPLTTVAFDEGSAAVVELVTEMVGAVPVMYDETEVGCAGSHTSYQWDSAMVTSWAGSMEFIVGLTAPSLGGIRLETTAASQREATSPHSRPQRRPRT